MASSYTGLFSDNEIREFIIKSTSDKNSFLRYMAVKLVLFDSGLKTLIKGKLLKMQDEDKNEAIKRLIKASLNFT